LPRIASNCLIRLGEIFGGFLSNIGFRAAESQ
jgi:hypothetical protein